MEYDNERRNCTDEKETYRCIRKHIKRQYTNERENEEIGGIENERNVLLYERRIRRYRTLSKRAMKEYAKKKANSSSFDWFEDEEEM